MEERKWEDERLADITMNRFVIEAGEDPGTDDSDDEDMGYEALEQ